MVKKLFRNFFKNKDNNINEQKNEEQVEEVLKDKKSIICNNETSFFGDGGFDQELFKEHHVIGAGLRANCICPYCSSIDRTRWLYWILSNKTKIFGESGRILHFAPEKQIEDLIKGNKNMDYYTCDIEPGRAMHVVDITDIQFADNTFDYIICNHVMEHIPNEKKAISEIKRVLKSKGKFIFSFPICTDMKTFEDKNISTAEERLEYYGQEDHVRLYGTDFKERFEKYGLNIKVFIVNKIMTAEEIQKYGFISDDIIMIATKK